MWRSWALATAVGEVIGFSVPAIAGAVAIRVIGEPEGTAPALGFYVLLLAAGVGEGAVLGTAQSLVLRRVLPSVSPPAWIGATAAAAGVAWGLGLLPSTFDALVSLPPELLVAAWVVLAPPLLCSVGVAQWLVLRPHVNGAGRWVTANVLGWLLGLPVTFIGPALVPSGSPPVVWAGVFIVCGFLMGAVVGIVTAVALRRMLAEYGRAAMVPGG